MTATDELRRLLDERGIEYYQGYMTTGWDPEGTGSVGTYLCYADEIVGGLRLTWDLVTPAQAVEATLGRGTCRAMQVPMGIHDDATATVCSECRVAIDDLPDCNYCPNCGRKVVDA